MRALGDYLNVKCHACVGGTSVREDTRILQSGVHVVVGTPGRVYDMLRRRALRADAIKMFVLDEADEMLSRGFKDQIYDIFQLLPPKIQVRAPARYRRRRHRDPAAKPAARGVGAPGVAGSCVVCPWQCLGVRRRGARGDHATEGGTPVGLLLRPSALPPPA